MLDGDTGNGMPVRDVDDRRAITLVTASPEIDLLACTTCGGNCPTAVHPFPRAIIERHDHGKASADWAYPRGLPLRLDKTIEPDPAGDRPDYPAVIRIWGGDARDEAARLADLVALMKRNAVIADRTQMEFLFHSVRDEHSGRDLGALTARGVPALSPRTRASFENDEIRFLIASFAVLFGWHGQGRGR